MVHFLFSTELNNTFASHALVTSCLVFLFIFNLRSITTPRYGAFHDRSISWPSIFIFGSALYGLLPKTIAVVYVTFIFSY